MASETFYIKLQPHFRLWVDLKDKIAFEAALREVDIPFHIDENQSTVGNGIRYFFLDKYTIQIDLVLKRIGVAASVDTINMCDPEINKNVKKMYLAVAATIILLLFIGTMLFGCKTDKTTPTEEKKPTLGKYYFDFDEVTHFQIDDKVINEVWGKKDKEEVMTHADSVTFDYVYQWHGKNAQLGEIVESRLSETKFKAHHLDATLNPRLMEIFRECEPLDFTTGCDPTFRDIFLLKKHGKVVGLAKICFECYKTEFTGENGNEDNFSSFKELEAIIK